MTIIPSGADDDWERTHARSSDPDTSKRAARSVKLRAKSQTTKLLRAFASVDLPMIDEKAFEMTDISPKACWWHRCSDLRKYGYIEFLYVDGVAVEHKSSVGEWCQTSVITAAGKKALEAIDEGH